MKRGFASKFLSWIGVVGAASRVDHAIANIDASWKG
jgi:hypothetical protein